jgi:hypothetical protein
MGANQKGSPRVTSHAPRSVGKFEGMNPTPPNELPLWEFEGVRVPMDSQIFREKF